MFTIEIFMLDALFNSRGIVVAVEKWLGIICPSLVFSGENAKVVYPAYYLPKKGCDGFILVHHMVAGFCTPV